MLKNSIFTFGCFSSSRNWRRASAVVTQDLCSKLSSCVRQCRRGFWFTCYPEFLEILGGSGIQKAL